LYAEGKAFKKSAVADVRNGLQNLSVGFPRGRPLSY